MKISIKVVLISIFLITFFISMLGKVSALSTGAAYKWQPVNAGLYGANITTLEFDANYPNTIYAGTSNEGIFVSSDLGKTWKWIGKGLELNLPNYIPSYTQVYAIKTVKGQIGVIYAGTSKGLYLSRDSGISWFSIGGISERRVFSIYISDKDPNFILLGTDNGVYRSLNDGHTFEAANQDITNISVNFIVPDVSMNEAYYIGTNRGVFKTVNGCESWLSVSNGLGGVVYSIAQNKRKPYMLYAASSTGVFRTYDYGDRWTNITNWETKPSVIFVGVDDFDDRLILAVTKSGIILSNDSGENWRTVATSNGVNINASLSTMQGFSTVYLGTDRGFAIYSDGSLSFNNQNLGLLNVTALGFDPNYSIIYAHDSLGLFKMGFNSSNWLYLSGALSGASPHAFAVDPKVPNSMFAATKYGIMRSTNNGADWSYTDLSSGEFYSVTFSRANPNYVYAGGETGIYISKDSGYRWSKLQTSIDLPIYSIVATTDGSLYVLTKNYLYKSLDGGKTFNIVSDKIGALKGITLTGDYFDSSILYLGTLDGVFYSKDGGLHWETMGNLPYGTVVYSIISINDSQNTVYIGTNSGVYKRITVEDSTPPVLTIISPSDGAKLNSPDLTISGSVTDVDAGIAQVTINGVPVEVKSDGAFTFNMTLSPGTNTISVKAVDKANNVSFKSLTVYYTKTTVLILFIGSSKMLTGDGKVITLDSPPIIVESRTLVPIRAIVEELGGSVAWNNAERKVTVTLGSTTIELWIDKPQARVNGNLVWIDPSNHKVAPLIKNGRTMIPLRFVVETLGAKLDWDGSLRKIVITYPAP